MIKNYNLPISFAKYFLDITRYYTLIVCNIEQS